MEGLQHGSVTMAELCNSLNWLSELPSQIKQVEELRDEIQGRKDFDGVVYEGDILRRFNAIHDFIGQCSLSLRKLMQRVVNAAVVAPPRPRCLQSLRALRPALLPA